MISQFQILDLNKTYFWVSDNALVEVRFSKAIIGTCDGATTYYATLPNGEVKTIKSKLDDPIKVYASPEDYIKKSVVAVPSIALDRIASLLKLQICYKEFEGERVGFHFLVWTIDDGIAKEHCIYADTITVSSNGNYANNTYTINDDFPDKYYKNRDLMEKLYPTKVIAEDGSESVVGGELSALFLSDEQKVILDEWLAVTKKLAAANITIISSEATGKYLAVNNSQIDQFYGYEESYKGIVALDADEATDFQIPKIPLNVCNDYDSGEMWFMMKK